MYICKYVYIYIYKHVYTYICLMLRRGMLRRGRWAARVARGARPFRGMLPDSGSILRGVHF